MIPGDAELIIVDECHGLHKTVIDRIGKRDTIVIGLSATPFTKGIGKHYDSLSSIALPIATISDGVKSLRHSAQKWAE